MPKRLTRSAHLPDDSRLPPELLQFREERPQRQAELADYLVRLRKNVPGMTQRLAETYLLAAGTPLSSSHLSRLEQPARMAHMENINLPPLWAMIHLYNGEISEVDRILMGRRRVRSILEQQIAERQAREAGMLAAYRTLPNNAQETVLTLIGVLAKTHGDFVLANTGEHAASGSEREVALEAELARLREVEDLRADRLNASRLSRHESDTATEQQTSRHRRRGASS